MEPIAKGLQKRVNPLHLKKIQEKILSDSAVQTYIQAHHLTDQQVQKSLAKFTEFINELAKFRGSSQAAYKPILIENEGMVEVAYEMTPALLNQQKVEEKRNRIHLVGLPTLLKDVELGDIYADNASRANVLRAFETMITSKDMNFKGLYLYGDFGVGKSFMMAALANELARRGLVTTLIHYPSLVSEGSLEELKDRANDLKKSQVLVLDDVGAESNNAWLRDNVFQVILQYRMDNKLPTFFTSNLTMEELENHLAETRNERDLWPAKRIMERVKYLSRQLHLEGVNHRHE